MKQKMSQIMIPDSPSPFSNEDWSGLLDDDDVFESNIDIVISEPLDDFVTLAKK